MMEVGEVRIAEDKDFEQLRFYLDVHDDWRLDYNKSHAKVWTRNTEGTSYKMIKVRTIYKDVKPAVLYDVLHDPGYRRVWDKYMIDSYDIGFLNINNDVGYYSVKSPSPLKNRDFVLHRSWLATESELMIINHSVFHKNTPSKKGYIRATSYLTGFLIRSSGNGCDMGYVTQCDLKGSLPPWLVNKATQIFVPKLVKRIHNACLGYEAWKEKHNPTLKPWLYPEQITAPKLLPSQFLSEEMNKSNESLDSIGLESNFKDDDYMNDEKV